MKYINTFLTNCRLRFSSRYIAFFTRKPEKFLMANLLIFFLEKKYRNKVSTLFDERVYLSTVILLL